MAIIVLDASVTICWLLPDEDDPRADVALERLRRDGAIVPQIWHPEVRNALYQAERRGRTAPTETEESFGQLNNILVATDSQPDFDVTLALARLHNLSLYDALYLEFAKRCNVELTTLETRLGSAAAREGLLMTTA